MRDVTLTRGDKMQSCLPKCVGVSPAVLDMNLHTLEHGRFFTDLDEENANAVCVIGTGIRDELFGSPEQSRVTRSCRSAKSSTSTGNPSPSSACSLTTKASRTRKSANWQRQHPTTAKPAPRGARLGRAGQLGFLRKNQTIYMPLNTAWLRFRAAGDKRRHSGQAAHRHRFQSVDLERSNPRCSKRATF